MTVPLNKPTTDSLQLTPSAAELEALTDVLRSAGIPLSLDPSIDELQQATLLHRQRRRVELVQFLGRIVAQGISDSSNAPPGDKLC